MDRLAYLRSRLLPRGTPMCAVAPDRGGLRITELIELMCLEYRTSAPPPDGSELDAVPIAGPRDRYGWRSLPSGTRYLGAVSSRRAAPADDDQL